jgi:hypothetical protein
MKNMLQALYNSKLLSYNTHNNSTVDKKMRLDKLNCTKVNTVMFTIRTAYGHKIIALNGCTSMILFLKQLPTINLSMLF